MLQIKHYEMLETFNNEKSNLETPWVAYVEENSTVYYSVDDVIKYRTFLVRQKDISNITYEAIDLGLPSGLKWADRNVGASSPEDFGSYFQWGDTNAYTFDGKGEVTATELAELLNPMFSAEFGIEVTKDNIKDVLLIIFDGYDVGTNLTNTPIGGMGLSLDKSFDLDSYFDTTDGGSTFNKYNNNDGLTVIESIDDAATVHMGNTWRMPNADETKELIDNTTHTFIDLNGNEYSQEEVKNVAIESGNLKGVRFTGSNGNSIFIPAAGYSLVSLMGVFNTECNLWSSSKIMSNDSMGIYLGFDCNGNVYNTDNNIATGRSVRGVLKQ